jgi:membrane protease YdiL (CAAX protease family)
MSLLAFVFMKISKNTEATEGNLILANVISAVLFAAAHLPSTAMTIGLDALIIVRCFVMNGAYGVVFGELYRKYGIWYAMLAHAGVHIVSKAVWWLLI